MFWTLRRILIVIVVMSALAIVAALYWTTATYQNFAIKAQEEFTASTLAHLVRRQVQEEHQRKVNPFIDEWSRLSTLRQAMSENDAVKARIAADRMMLTLEVAEGRVQLRNVVIYDKAFDPVAEAGRGSAESVSGEPAIVDILKRRPKAEQRRITSFMWRSPDGRPLYSTIAPIGGFRVDGFVEFVSDPIPDLAGISDAVIGDFKLLDVNDRVVFAGRNSLPAESVPGGPDLTVHEVPIRNALGQTWAIASLTRDVSEFKAKIVQLRDQALGTLLLVVFGICIFGWLLLRLSVFRRLRDFARAMSMLANGRTDVEIPAVGSDEFQNMRLSLESLRSAVIDRQNATAALRESEARVRAIIDNSPYIIYLKDIEGRYTLVNTMMAEISGLDPDEMRGMTAYDHLAKADADDVAEMEREVIRTGEFREREAEISLFGRTRFGIVAKFPVFDTDGELYGFGTTIIDITERKNFEKDLLATREKAEQQARLQRVILDNVGQGILVFQEGSKLLLWNDLATKFTGFSVDMMKDGMTMQSGSEFQLKIFETDERVQSLVEDFDRRLAAGERGFVVTYQRPGIDKTSWVQASLRCLPDGMVVQTFQDISDLHHAIDTALQAQRQAEAASRAKSDFLSNMSHELRTPLNAIIGFTEFVIENDEEPITEEQEESLSQVLKAGRHLLLLINDVLDLSKIEAGAVTLSIEPIDAGLAVDECLSLTLSFAAGRNVTIKNLLPNETLPAIEADRIRFKQVFLNLLSNAIKYNNDPGTVTIERGQSKPGLLRIGVRDSGPGIPPELIKNIFDPFDRLGAENSAIEGTGIGLTITRSLMEQMGGTVTVDSKLGEGATFWIDVPVSDRPADAPLGPAEAETGPAIEGLVLYIEDNPANLELVRKILNRQPGLDFLEAHTGEIGIERAVAETPDVILLDINLPGMDGFQVLEVLQTHRETRHIPVIALTAAATQSDIRRGHAAGFYSYLTKPIAARELLDTIRYALSPPVPPSRGATAGTTGKVVVVDDMPINLAITQKQLAKLGIACELVEDPLQALEMLKTGAFRLALVDIGMPTMSGIELTKRLREAEKGTGSYTPVVALTASYGTEEDTARMLRAGMDGQLTKPVNLKDLVATLNRWVPDDPEPHGTGERDNGATGAATPPAPADDIGPPVDLEAFREIIGTDDTQTIQDMFAVFIDTIPTELKAISDAVAAQELSRTREAAHRFKSAALNTAAGRLSDILLRIETEARNGSWNGIDIDLKRAAEECDRLVDYVRDKIGGPSID